MYIYYIILKNLVFFLVKNYLNFFENFFFFKFCFCNLIYSYRLTFFYIEVIVRNNFFLIIFLTLLKKIYRIKLKLLLDIIVIDFFHKKIRFQINYLLSSVKFNYKLIVSIFCHEKNPQLSICSLFKNANWYEREIWDLFGIHLLNHIDLRRILTDYNFFSFPLRKDFPLSGFFELYYSDSKKKIILTKTSFLQKYRFFNLKYRWLNKIN